ncbi:hypothetical protein ACWT_5277 [Actinoplanes sp. SE50]|uniref:hypothetical protein n=1 Tax=unclassified Actinoplanes TaxID=2626549 RepID=UPI00023EBF74|nr:MULTISPECIES: hypothetical protein [unclassified Actinoplanes]AEV86295.1 hypothetical protein ACPL_5408 [Actinoplanes sp. SE50/110]ATO84692.1 hypothetical protein ACWT_5277 [Actinoplanes sp. SE50]SLM02102.1 hypothetical protein ACSP50_5340 [Actinoplanes sp. SE50/110]
MGEPATPIRRRIELSIAETRLRFQQLVRLTGLTGQVTVVVDGGRPIAAIVPAADVLRPPSPPDPPGRSGAGWLQRIEKVRDDVRRQHAGRIQELSQALDEAWQMLDQRHPPGTDRHVDALRAAQRDVRRTR